MGTVASGEGANGGDGCSYCSSGGGGGGGGGYQGGGGGGGAGIGQGGGGGGGGGVSLYNLAGSTTGKLIDTTGYRTAAQRSANSQSVHGIISISPVFGKLDQTITFGALADKTYGDAPFAVSATASSGRPVSFSASDSCTVSGTTVTITGAGSCTITASQAGNDSYNAAPSVSQGFSIAKASLAVSASNASRAFGAPNPSFSGTVTGLVADDNITVSYQTTATQSSPVGTYPIAPVLSDPDGRLTNYNVTLNKNGGLYFSSSWNGTRTAEQTLGGGNLVVR